MLPKNYLLTNHVYSIYMYKQNLAWNNLKDWYAVKQQPTHQPTNNIVVVVVVVAVVVVIKFRISRIVVFSFGFYV